MITVQRRICFAATAAMIINDTILDLFSVDYDGKEEQKERQPPPTTQGPAKISSTTELENIRAVKRKNIRPALTGGGEEGVSTKSLNDRPKKRPLCERSRREKPTITIDTA